MSVKIHKLCFIFAEQRQQEQFMKESLIKLIFRDNYDGLPLIPKWLIVNVIMGHYMILYIMNTVSLEAV